MPTPNDMPGADTGAAVDVEEPTQDTIDVSSREVPDDPDGLDAPVVSDPEAEIARLRQLVRRNRKWEDKARQNAEKARKHSPPSATNSHRNSLPSELPTYATRSVPKPRFRHAS